MLKRNKIAPVAPVVNVTMSHELPQGLLEKSEKLFDFLQELEGYLDEQGPRRRIIVFTEGNKAIVSPPRRSTNNIVMFDEGDYCQWL